MLMNGRKLQRGYFYNFWDKNRAKNHKEVLAEMIAAFYKIEVENYYTTFCTII